MVKIKPTQEARKLGKKLYLFLPRVNEVALKQIGKDLQTMSRRIAPHETGALKRSIVSEYKESGGLTNFTSSVEIYSTVDYADAVHDGGHPRPITPGELANLTLWAKKRGLENQLYIIKKALTEVGIRNPTPFFKQAESQYRNKDVRYAYDAAIKKVLKSRYYKGIIEKKL